MRFTQADYIQRLRQLIPIDCYVNLKSKDPLLYFEKRMKKLNDDYQSIYWYSILFLSKEFHKLPYVERVKYLFDREIFRCKYIKLGKLELFYQLLEYVEQNEKAFLLVGNNDTMLLIDYVLYLISVTDFHTLPLYLYEYEFNRITKIKLQASDMFLKLLDFRLQSCILFFTIFYKGALAKYNLESGILEQIYHYTFDSL